MIRLHRPHEPPAILANEGAAQTRRFCEQYDADPASYQGGTAGFQFDRAIYGDPLVKQALREMQHNKCCFCEACVPHISSGDVEHYRPKAGFRQEQEGELERPGYYWLAYDWENLLFCCEICNRRHKRDLFPLADPRSRARSHHGAIAQESPLFVNPAAEDPAQSISFNEEVPLPVAGSARDAATIRAIGLDRPALNERRLGHLQTSRLIVALALLFPGTPEGRKAREWVERAQSDGGEYASMVRAYLARNHPELLNGGV
jgi:uncharacterized protein (TIGR02646 family)